MYHNGLPSLGANFPLFSSFSRNFSNLKNSQYNQNTHKSKISHKVYVCTCASGLW